MGQYPPPGPMPRPPTTRDRSPYYNKNNRRGATRPYYREQAVRGWMALVGVSLIVGAMLGATVALWWLT